MSDIKEDCPTLLGRPDRSGTVFASINAYDSAGATPGLTVNSPKPTCTDFITKFFTIALQAKVVFGLTAALASLDIFLLERKYNVFSGGFLQTVHIVQIADRAAFVLTIFSLEMALGSFVWCTLLALRKSRKTSLRAVRYQYFGIYGGLSIAVIILKYKILTYFGDFISLSVLKNLGGGSLTQAILYATEEGIVPATVCLAATVTVVYLYYRGETSAVSVKKHIPWVRASHYLYGAALSILALALLATYARSDRELHKMFSKITPFAIADVLATAVMTRGESTLVRLRNELPNSIPDIPSSVTFPTKKDNLILIVSESTRADVLDATVKNQFIAPNWRALAADGGSANHYFSHTGFTISSLKAIFRGSLGISLPLGGTLFEILKNEGYQVVVISGQDESFGDIARDTKSEIYSDIFFDARSAIGDRVFPSKEAGSLTISNKRVVREFNKVANRIDWSRPVFMYINLQSPHFPYYHPDMPTNVAKTPIARNEISREKQEELKLTYYNAVEYADWATGEIVSRLKTLGVYKKSLVAVAGDHGESLFDDGVLGHGIKIANAQLNALLVANRNISSFNKLIGQTDIARIFLREIGATVSPSPPAPDAVIQIIGNLNDPDELGYVYENGDRFTFDNAHGALSASWLKNSIAVSKMDESAHEAKEMHRLVAEWKKGINVSVIPPQKNGLQR